MYYNGFVHRVYLFIRLYLNGVLLGSFILLPLFSFSFLLYFIFCPSAYASVTAMTVNSIKGTQPYLILPDGVTKLTDLNQLLDIEMPKQDGSAGLEKIDTSMAETSLVAPLGMTFNQVVTVITADGVLHDLNGLTVGSDDGDAAITTNTKVNGQMKATWYNGLSQKITNLNQPLTSCGGPYTLTIEVPTEVIASTTYGLPRSMTYGTHSGVSYTFISENQGICYLKPKNITVYTGTEGRNIKFAKGYNADKWELNKGFKVSANFPTTGFYNASFSLIGSGNDQRKYRCTSQDDGGKIALSGTSSTTSGANCTITYNSMTKNEFMVGGMPTVTMEYDMGDGIWKAIDSYTIPVPNKWAVIRGKLLYANQGNLLTATSFPTLDECRLVVDGDNSSPTTNLQATDLSDEGKLWRQKYLYRRNELTNSPYSDPIIYPEASKPAYLDSFYSRDVDGTFTGEWGNLNDYSGWGTLFWSADIYSIDNYAYQYDIHSYGSVHYVAATGGGYATVCRGD